VDTTGTYDLTVISASGFPSSPTDSLMFLYTPAFLPPSSVTNCIAASDDAIGLNPFISITLQANTAYDVVILNAWSPGVSSPGGIFTGQISGAGQICFGAPCGTAVVPPDDRLNWMFGDGTAPKRGRRATSDQNKFQRLRDNMKGNATWFVHNAPMDKLKQ
jgi:hypothetical protein